MKKKDFLKTLNTLYTKVSKKIIDDMPSDKETLKISPLKAIQTFTQKNIEKVKEVGFKEALLTMGTPYDETPLLYSEVIKKEKLETKNKLKHLKEIAKQKKETEKSLKHNTSKKQTSTKTNISKSTTTKVSVKKTITKTATKKHPSNEKKVKTKTKKSSTTIKGSKRDEKIVLYIKDIKKHYGEVDEDFLALIVKNLGPSIYRKDAELVSCSDPKELDTVRRNFLIKKLGIDEDKSVLDATIQEVCTELKGIRTKYRATFYYRLAKKFKKESVLS